MFKFSQREINELSKQTGFQKDILEKVLRLTSILRFLNDQSLFEPLKLKGGTALGLSKFNFKRLSVDMDFDYHSDLERSLVLKNREEITDLLVRYMETNGYSLNSGSKFHYSLDSFVFKYVNLRGNIDNLLIEINYTNRVHVLEPIKIKINNDIIKDLEVNMLNELELYATKISALINRTTPRDIYDTYLLLKENHTKDSDFDLLKKLIIFYYSLSSHDEDYQQKIKQAIEIIQNMAFHQIKRTLIPVLSKNDSYSHSEASYLVRKFLNQLSTITINEQEYLNDTRKLNFKFNLLFDNQDITNKLNNHPRVLWLKNK